MRVTKVADANGESSPTTTASAPVSAGTVPATVGGEGADVTEIVRES